MASPPEVDGIIGWLIYAVLGLGTALLALWNKHIVGRISRVETKASSNVSSLHQVELSIKDRFASHEKEERDRADTHSREVREEFKALSKRVEDGHREILEKLAENEK